MQRRDFNKALVGGAWGAGLIAPVHNGYIRALIHAVNAEIT
jgi:hypothetical protein